MSDGECRGCTPPAAIAYALDLAIDDRARRVSGRWRMRFSRAASDGDLVLDYRGGVSAATLCVNGAFGAATRAGGVLVIPARDLLDGENTLEMPVESDIAPGGTPVLRHDDPEDGAAYVYSLFVPADASALFPCLDRPDAKARFQLTLTLPDGWTAVSCAPALDRCAGRIAFADTPPLPTYAFAFAAGPFAAIAGADERFAGRAFVRRAAADRLRDDAREALRLAQAAMDWGERHFGAPFPFAKHDLVVVPAFPFGGMEHAGATFLDEAAIAPGPAAGEGARRRRAHLVFHETAHQWLGDCVTMGNFTDLWLKEGFANLGAALCAEACAPDTHPWLGLHRLKASAVRADLAAGAAPVRRPVAHAAEAKTLYGPGVYGKAPALLRQGRHLIGADAFDTGVRAFVRRHAFGAATCDDLGAALESVSDRPMRAWLHGWLDAPGVPTLRLALDVRNGRIAAARVLRAGAAPVQRLEAVAIDADGTVRRAAYVADADAVELPEWTGDPVPVIAFANAGDLGYARVLLDDATREAALERLDLVPDALLRLQIVEALWEHVREATLDPARFLAFALARLAGEREWAVAAALVEHAGTAAARYVDRAERDAAKPVLERARQALAMAPPEPADPRCTALLGAAARPDADGKARCFDALLHDASLPDRWIELAAERFNAIDHEALTLPFVEPALRALPALAAARRIFFADRWLAAFVGGRASAAALAAVERVLAAGALAPELAQKARLHAEELARTVRIRGRYAREP